MWSKWYRLWCDTRVLLLATIGQGWKRLHWITSGGMAGEGEINENHWEQNTHLVRGKIVVTNQEQEFPSWEYSTGKLLPLARAVHRKGTASAEGSASRWWGEQEKQARWVPECRNAVGLESQRDRTSLDSLGRNSSGFPCVYVVGEGTRLEAAIGKKIVGKGRQSDKQMEGNNTFCLWYVLFSFLTL